MNWTKFSQIARSAAIVMDCPKYAPDLPINRAVEALLYNAPVYWLDDDDLYDISYSYRPRNSQKQQGGRSYSEGTVKKVQRTFTLFGKLWA